MNARTTKLGLLLVTALLAASCRDGKDGTAGAPGPVGPEGEGAARPRIDSLSPPVGSLRNVVFLTGTNFSAVTTENEVRFGGSTATVLEATATTLTVAPPFELDPGYAPVTVTRGDNVSAPAGFTLVASGTTLPSRLAAPRGPGEAVELADGRVLVADGDLGAILVLETDGTVRELARGQGLQFPQRMVAAPDGTVVVFDPAASAIFRVGPDDGVVEVEHWGTSYASGSHDAAGNLFAVRNGNTVDRIAPDGTVTADWCSATAIADVQVIGTDVYLGVPGFIGPASVVKCSTAASGTPALVTAIGITSISTLSAAGADLVATGIFTATNDQEGVVRIAANGTITAVTTDAAGQGRYQFLAGAIVLQGGEYLVSDRGHGFVGELSGTTLTIRAGAVAGAGASVRAAGKTYASAYRGAFTPGWIVETGDDGFTRVLAQGAFRQILAGSGGTSLEAVRGDGNREVVTVDLATGVVTPVFSAMAEIATPVALARDGAGNWYVGDTTGTIAQYGPTGTVLNATFATIANLGSLHVQDTVLVALSEVNGRAERITLSNGSVAPWVAPGAGISPAFLFRDSDESMARDLIADPAGDRVVDVDGYGFVAEFATGLSAPASIAQREDGMLMVRCDDGITLLTP